MKKLLVFMGAMILLLTGCGSQFGKTDVVTAEGPSVTLYGQKGKAAIKIEIADSFKERAQGLMYRKSLEPDAGMFFIFDTQKELTFWMKNTLIPLDIVFLNSDYKVVHIAKGVQPCKKAPCEYYKSGKVAKYALEINAGISDNLELKEGDRAEVKL